MTDKTFTDEEIVKALECCSAYDADFCSDCPAFGRCHKEPNFLEREALDLINRQKEEIDRLREINSLVAEAGQEWEKRYKTARNEAITEFAERMKKALTMEYHGIKISVKAECIDKIAEEMKGPTATEAKDFYSAEEVRKMTPKEVRGNYSAIMDSMKNW